MARYGSPAIRGHGIPEAMEQVLLNQSRIPARVTLLKPLSAAISIGTGGPFGAEGPIIATGGALGSLLGQVLETTALERKTLLAAGVSCLFMRNTIMTEKIVRRGVRVPTEYHPDYLDQVTVKAACTSRIVALGAEDTVAEVRRWIGSGTPDARHQAFPVLDRTGRLVGLVSRRYIDDPSQPLHRPIRDVMRARPPVTFGDCSLREAADQMARERAGRLPVVERDDAREIIGILTRTDVLAVDRRRLEETRRLERSLPLRIRGRRPRPASSPAPGGTGAGPPSTER